jgi:hypothetical protein
MKSTITLFLVILLFGHLSAQEPSPPVQILTDSIINMESIPVRHTSFLDTVGQQLDSIATNKELLLLTKHTDPLVRASAILVLVKRERDLSFPPSEKGKINFLELFVEHLQDTATVDFKIYEEHRPYIITETISSICADKIGRYFGSRLWLIPVQQLEVRKKDKRTMDSLVMCTSTPLTLERESLVYTLEAIPAFYEPIKQQVLKQKDENALIYLAKFQKEEDVDLILHNLPKGENRHGVAKLWFPFQFFQHPRFFEYLKNNTKPRMDDMRYLSRIAEYQSAEAASLLSEIYAKADKGGRTNRISNNLRAAISQNYCVHYANLFVQLLSENAPFGYLEIPDQLWGHRGDTLFQLYNHWKESDNKWAKKDAKYMYPKAKEFIEKSAPDQLVDVVMGNIEAGGDYGKSAKSFYHILETKKPVYIDPLFDLLEREPLAKHRFFITKILVSYDLLEVNQRLEQFYADYPELKPDIKAAEAGGSFFKDLKYYANRK